MSFFIAVLLASAVEGKGIYTFHEPVFDTKQQCVTYVQENARILGYKIGKDLGRVNIQSVYCLNEEQLNKVTGDRKDKIEV